MTLLKYDVGVTAHKQPSTLHPFLVHMGRTRIQDVASGYFAVDETHLSCKNPLECLRLEGLRKLDSCLHETKDHPILSHAFATCPAVIDVDLQVYYQGEVFDIINLRNDDGVTIGDVLEGLNKWSVKLWIVSNVPS